MLYLYYSELHSIKLYWVKETMIWRIQSSCNLDLPHHVQWRYIVLNIWCTETLIIRRRYFDENQFRLKHQWSRLCDHSEKCGPTGTGTHNLPYSGWAPELLNHQSTSGNSCAYTPPPFKEICPQISIKYFYEKIFLVETPNVTIVGKCWPMGTGTHDVPYSGWVHLPLDHHSTVRSSQLIQQNVVTPGWVVMYHYYWQFFNIGDN